MNYALKLQYCKCYNTVLSNKVNVLFNVHALCGVLVLDLTVIYISCNCTCTQRAKATRKDMYSSRTLC